MTGARLEAGDSGAVDPMIAALADTIDPDWPRVDDAWEGVRRRRRDVHLRRDAGLDPHEFLCQALALARGLHVLRTFVAELILQGLDNESFHEALTALLPASYELQSYLDGAFRPVPAYRYGRGLIEACSHICRIDIQGDGDERKKHAGTGVLVRPTLVATASHVVAPLLERLGDGTLRARPDTVGRITLTFGDFLDYAEEDGQVPPPTAGRPATLHADWLAWVSGLADLEEFRTRQNIANVDGITADGPWDVALLRLAERPDGVLRPPRIRADAVPHGEFAVQLLHHPTSGFERAHQLLVSTGRVDRLLGEPAVRCLHTANTLPGSSGAPVYDDQWRIVALHQSGPTGAQRAAAAAAPGTGRNRAVPVARWLPHLDVAERALDAVTYLDYLEDDLENLPIPYPVVGRRQTQRAVHAARQPAAAAESRLLILRGPEGSGRRFTRRLVAELVRAPEQFRALDLANLAGQSPERLAEIVVRKVTGDATPLLRTGTTTGRRDIRDVVVPAMIDKLGTFAGDRQLWLLLEGLAPPGGEMSPNVADLLSALVERLVAVRSLRLVLVGWPDKAPTGYETCVEDLLMPGAEDIAAHFAPGGEAVDPVWVQVIRDELDRLAAEESLTGYPAALRVIDRIGSRILTAATEGTR